MKQNFIIKRKIKWKCIQRIVFYSECLSQEPIKVVKPKPKRPSEEQKKTEKTKVELKRRIPQEFQDFGESKISAQNNFKRNDTKSCVWSDLDNSVFKKKCLWSISVINTLFEMLCGPLSVARKSVRQSTSEHTRKTNLRLQERQDAPRRRRGAHRDRPLTQEELLAEAKITAELNIRSLGKYMTENNHFLIPFFPLALYVGCVLRTTIGFL